MKKIFALAAVLSLVAFSSANAATIKLTPTGDTYALYLNGEASVFDTISVAMSSDTGDFLAQDGGFNGFFPRTAGEPFSFVNALLAAPAAQGGKGLTVVGTVNTPDALNFDATFLGGNIATGGDLFLANVNFPAPGKGTASVSLIAGGQVIQTLSAPIGAVIPEPATVALAGMGLIGLAAARRRRA